MVGGQNRSPRVRGIRHRAQILRRRCKEWLDIQLGLSERRPTRLSLSQLDAIPYLTEQGTSVDPTVWERIEQLDAHRYVRSDHRVLELGGCYGLVSCVINHNLSNPKQHVVVEPAREVIAALQHNRDTHRALFHIFNGVVACQPMVIRGKGLSRWTEPCADGNVPYLTVQQIEERYRTSFNCFVADCEGGLEQFVREFPAFFDNVDTVLFERDREWEDSGTKCDYCFIERFLESGGFNQIKTGSHPVWMK